MHPIPSRSRRNHRPSVAPTLLLLLAWGFAVPKESLADAPGDSDFLSRIRQVTFEGRRAGESYLSADGKQLVFQSEREPGNPFFQIYLLDLETGDTRRVSPGHGKTTCAWIHPDHRSVLFASTHEDPNALQKQQAELDARASGRQRRYSWDYDEHYEIYKSDGNTGALTNLTRALGYDAEGSWSPDGTLIAFASNRSAFEGNLSAEDQELFKTDKAYFNEIYIMNGDGSNLRRLTRTPGYDGGPFFSPDGQRICWRRFSEDGATAEVYTQRIDGSDQRQITHLGAMSWAPFYHPSGAYLIFTTNRHGFSNFELYLVDAAGEKEPVRVTTADGFDGLPAFTPSGDGLFWTTNRTTTKQSQIFAANWNHAAALRSLRAAPPSKPSQDDRRVDSSEKEGPLERRDSSARRGAKVAGGPAALPPLPQTEAAIRPEDLRGHVEQLASEAMAGRLTGTPGERLATAYAAQAFTKIGLTPAGDGGTYFQEFSFTAGVDLARNNRLALEGADDGGTDSIFVLDEDWRPLAFSATGDVAASPVVFAGYGISAPATEGAEEYDSFVHLDVKDKWVLALRYLPEDVSPERRQQLSRYSSLRYKAMVARDKGARGLLLVSGPNSQVKHELVRLGFDAALAGTSIAAISISNATAGTLLERAGKSLVELQTALDGGEPSLGFELGDVRLSATVALEKVTRTGRNVLGRLHGATVAAGRGAIVVGAHIDHLGRGGSGSLARDDERDQIHYGADDNASGVATILEIAEYLHSRLEAGSLHLERDIIFAAWSGEELGLVGSKHYVDALAAILPKSAHGEAPHLRSRLAAYINLDMVGRLREKLTLNGTGSSSIWHREIERRNAPIGLSLSLLPDTYLPTDATSFYLKGVPILSAFTGSHDEYHSPRDVPELLNYDGMESIGRFLALVCQGLATNAEAPDYVEQQAPENRGARAGLRAYLGTIPDYSEGAVKGLRLSGVAAGGPAEKAGLKGDDVVVELAGRKIENIYDYTYAIDAVKIGTPAKVIVVRAGKQIELEITPTSRE